MRRWTHWPSLLRICIVDCWISGNQETMSTHCVVHRLLKNLSFFYCCFSVKASTLNPRTSTFCSLLHLRTIVRRNSKLWQFCNYLNSMVLSHLIRLTRITFLICTLMAFEVIFITIKLTVWTCLIINWHARKYYYTQGGIFKTNITLHTLDSLTSCKIFS